MTDRSVSSGICSSLDEQWRAIDHFHAVLDVHSSAMRAFELLAVLPEPAMNLTAMLRVRHGGDSTATFDSFHERAQGVLAKIAAERDRDFQVIRGSALTAACAAFEYAVKSTLVSQAEFVSSGTVGLPSIEQQFVNADQLFQQVGRNDPKLKSMHKRIRNFVLEHAKLDDDHKAAFAAVMDSIEGNRLDESFLVRNSLVHNGGRVSTDLAQMASYEFGCVIKFGAGDVDRMVDPMRAIVRALEHRL